MASNSPFPLGAFVGGPNGSDAAAQSAVTNQFNSFVTTMGAAPQFMNAYVDLAKPIDQWAANASWTAWSWAQMSGTSGITPLLGLPMATSADAGHPDAVFKAFAAGQYDDALKGVVKSWADHGFSTQYWRPGYEMNLSSMPWFVSNDTQTQADFVSAFQHIAGVLHGAGQASGVNVQVVWSPNIQNWNPGVDVLGMYPGNHAVDVIGPDQYDNMYPRDLYDWAKNDGTVDSSFAQWASNPVNVAHYFTYPSANQWHPTGDGQGNSVSLQSFIDLAKANGKPIAVSESGAGGGGSNDTWENPAFVKWMASTLHNAGVPVSFVSTWDINDNGPWDFSSGSAGKPLTEAAWQQNFGAGASASAAASTIAAVPTSAAAPSSAASPSSATAPNSAPASSSATGPGSLVVNLSENAWQGDAQVIISVGGKQVGGTQTITASHSAGQSQAVQLQGDFGSGQNTVSVNFINDAYGGSAGADRNVYVDSIVANGTTIQQNAALLSAGSKDFAVPVASSNAATAPSAFVTATTAAIPAGDATLTASFSELFDFTSAQFGRDIISGFDPSSNVIKLPASQAADFAAVQNDLSSSGGNAILTLDSSHSITLQGIAPSSLSASNFAFG
jgi:hypothetical protein